MFGILNDILKIVFVVLFFYQFVFFLIPFFKKDKPQLHKLTQLHRYAILIAARNEENVVANLLTSIRNQTYPAALIDIFVVADNCTDHTAEVARKSGAIVWERFNKEYIGKGYAIKYLLKKVSETYGSDTYDGFFVFDADNCLDSHYIEEMNQTFSTGYKMITSYRNSTNFDGNWISSGYAINFLRESQFVNRPRMILGTSCAISGTGFLFSKDLLDEIGGWNFFLLTEDIQFSVETITRGYQIAYNPNAIFYDEQPLHFSISWNQRKRWVKGNLQVFKQYKKQLFTGLWKNKTFACYDMMNCTCFTALLALVGTVIQIGSAIEMIIQGTPLPLILSTLAPGLLSSYLTLATVAFVTVLSEWNRISCSTWKKCVSIITFPIYMATYIPITFAAVFTKTVWKPIPHGASIHRETKEKCIKEADMAMQNFTKKKAKNHLCGNILTI